jgi:hypothetical protein
MNNIGGSFPVSSANQRFSPNKTILEYYKHIGLQESMVSYNSFNIFNPIQKNPIQNGETKCKF